MLSDLAKQFSTFTTHLDMLTDHVATLLGSNPMEERKLLQYQEAEMQKRTTITGNDLS
jgi:hypothetical protein